MGTKDKAATPLTEEQLFEREKELNSKSEKLTADKKQFEQEKEDFEAEKKDFKVRLEELEKREASLSSGATEEIEIIEDFSFENEEYEFAPGAPQIIRHGGQKFSRAEIIENDDVLEELIGGNSNLIRKKQ